MAQLTPQDYSQPGREIEIGASDLPLSIRESGHDDSPLAADGGSGQLVLAFDPAEGAAGQAEGLPRHVEVALGIWHKEGNENAFLVEAASLHAEWRHAPDPSLLKTSGETPERMEGTTPREGREHSSAPDFLAETALALLPGKLDAAPLPGRSEADLGRVRSALPDQPGDEDTTAAGAVADASPDADPAPAPELRLPPPQAVLAPLGKANLAVVATTVVGRPDDPGASDAEETASKQLPITQFVVGLGDAPALPQSVAHLAWQGSCDIAQAPTATQVAADQQPHRGPTRDSQEEDNDPAVSVRPQPHAHTAPREKMLEGLGCPWQGFLNGLWPRDGTKMAKSLLLMLNILLTYGLWRMDKGGDALRR
jgi:hypothetical protein